MSHTHTQKHARPHKLEFNLWGEAFREVAMRKKDTDASISHTMMKLRIRYEGEGDLTFTINLLSFSCMLITFGLQFTVNVWEKHLEQLVGRQLGLQRHH